MQNHLTLSAAQRRLPLAPARVSRLAAAAFYLSCVPLVMLVLPRGMEAPQWAICLVESCPFAALACAVIARKRIQHSGGRLGGRMAARAALILTFFEIQFLAMLYQRVADNPRRMMYFIAGLLILSLYVYALWPVRGDVVPEVDWAIRLPEQQNEPNHN
jgi:hypothetical protein